MGQWRGMCTVYMVDIMYVMQFRELRESSTCSLGKTSFQKDLISQELILSKEKDNVCILSCFHDR